MCGRYSITTTFEAVRKLFGLRSGVPNWWVPRYNVAPTQLAPVVRLRDGERELVQLRWGLIPFWAKDEKIGYQTINAKCETIATKPAFREAFRRRHCLVATDGFYEWLKPASGPKQPFRIVRRDRAPFALAGLWERWRPAAGAEAVETFTVITCAPNDVCAALHDRMPVIVDPADYAEWLAAAPGAEALLRPCPADALEAYPVPAAVGNVRNEGPELIEPVAGRAAAAAAEPPASFGRLL
ncbi:MAG: SOS response-associated peptidase [Dongiaceae bacterium]